MNPLFCSLFVSFAPPIVPLYGLYYVCVLLLQIFVVEVLMYQLECNYYCYIPQTVSKKI